MKYVVVSLIATVLTVLFVFQNCQQPPYPDQISSQDFNAAGNSKGINLDQESLQTISLIISTSKDITKAGNTYQLNYNKNLQIELKTGTILETSNMDNDSKLYCLNESLKNELVSILKSSQVCRTQPKLPEGTVCTQVIKSPYAQLVTDKEQFDLGSASDGCGSNTIDLCGDQSSILKAYITNLNNQYQQMKCQ